jgi:cephalosporin hydroxylase
MKLTIDTDNGTCTIVDEAAQKVVPLYSNDAFSAIAYWYLKIGWNQRYTYTFSWFGRPIIQLPDDMIRIQEVIYRTRPDYIVETGVAHGGSLIYYASLCEAMHHGEVIGIDIEIRKHNRAAIEAHPLASRIRLIEGSSTAPEIVREVADAVEGSRSVLVLLDSNHSYEHVRRELELYSPLVTADSYIVATDGFMESLTDVPRGHSSWRDDNPAKAARDFAAAHPEFNLETPERVFDESTLGDLSITHWPSAYLRRIKNQAENRGEASLVNESSR